MSVEDTLKERGERYGSFTSHARMSQALKTTMHLSDGWYDLSNDKREALEMIAYKIGRILNGDPNYKDSWHDIEGYARLISNTLED